MSEKPAAPTPAVTDVVGVVDDARQGAAGMRTTAKWIGGAIAGIPALTIVATILKPPEGSTFEPWLLSIGIVLAVLGALGGIISLARVFQPVLTEDADLRHFDLRRVPEAVDDSYDELLANIQGDHRHAAYARTRSGDAKVAAAPAEAELAEAEARLKQAEEALKGDPENPDKLAFASAARLRLSTASTEAARAKGKVDAASRASEVAKAHLRDRLSIRRVAYQLAAADGIASRYKTAIENTVIAGIAVALGVAFVLLSSQVNDDTTPATPGPDTIDVVTLKLNQVGQTELGCARVETVQALLLKADKAAPTVITLPSQGCPARKVVFRLEKKPLGKLESQPATGG